MFDFALEEFDFFGGQVEQGVDAVVQVGFGVGQRAGKTLDGRAPTRRAGMARCSGPRCRRSRRPVALRGEAARSATPGHEAAWSRHRIRPLAARCEETVPDTYLTEIFVARTLVEVIHSHRGRHFWLGTCQPLC